MKKLKFINVLILMNINTLLFQRHQIRVVTMETSVAVYESNFVGSIIPQLILEILLNTKRSWNSLSMSEADNII